MIYMAQLSYLMKEFLIGFDSSSSSSHGKSIKIGREIHTVARPFSQTILIET